MQNPASRAGSACILRSRKEVFCMRLLALIAFLNPFNKRRFKLDVRLYIEF